MENLKKLKNNKLYLLKKNTPIGSINKRDLLKGHRVPLSLSSHLFFPHLKTTNVKHMC